MKKWIVLVWLSNCFGLLQNTAFGQEKINIFRFELSNAYYGTNSFVSRRESYGVSFEHVFKKKEASMWSYQVGAMYGKPITLVLDGNTGVVRNQAFDIGVLVGSLNYSLGRRNSKLIILLENAFRYGNTPFVTDIGSPNTYDSFTNLLMIGAGYRLLSLKSGLFIQLIFKLPIIGITNTYNLNLLFNPNQDVYWTWGAFNNQSDLMMGGLQLSFGWALPALKRTKYPKE